MTDESNRTDRPPGLIRRREAGAHLSKPDPIFVEREIFAAIRLRIRRFFGYHPNLEGAWNSYAGVLTAAENVTRAQVELEAALADLDGVEEIIKERQAQRKKAHQARMSVLRYIEQLPERSEGRLSAQELRELAEIAIILGEL